VPVFNVNRYFNRALYAVLTRIWSMFRV